ncbi:MAG TPA: hypothetical protein VFA18_24535, partial [Gemmataceae bacterium]|nr:hypothetical protein [Gemmataceae bacterium]
AEGGGIGMIAGTAIFKSNTLEYNTAGGGEGLKADGSAATATNPPATLGSGGGALGGGLYVGGGKATIDTETIAFNSANGGFSKSGTGAQSTNALGGGYFVVAGTSTIDATTKANTQNNTTSSGNDSNHN